MVRAGFTECCDGFDHLKDVRIAELCAQFAQRAAVRFAQVREFALGIEVVADEPSVCVCDVWHTPTVRRP